jgi:hypothetical protein
LQLPFNENQNYMQNLSHSPQTHHSIRNTQPRSLLGSTAYKHALNHLKFAGILLKELNWLAGVISEFISAARLVTSVLRTTESSNKVTLNCRWLTIVSTGSEILIFFINLSLCYFHPPPRMDRCHDNLPIILDTFTATPVRLHLSTRDHIIYHIIS